MKTTGRSSHHIDFSETVSSDNLDVDRTPAEEIRLNWLSINEGLIQAAIRGNVRAFLVLREEAWGIPISGSSKTIAEIPLEDLLYDETDFTRQANGRARETEER
jgi:hypothetical protein